MRIKVILSSAVVVFGMVVSGFSATEKINLGQTNEFILTPSAIDEQVRLDYLCQYIQGLSKDERNEIYVYLDRGTEVPAFFNPPNGWTNSDDEKKSMRVCLDGKAWLESSPFERQLIEAATPE